LGVLVCLNGQEDEKKKNPKKKIKKNKIKTKKKKKTREYLTCQLGCEL
jgi:hypothetical protein